MILYRKKQIDALLVTSDGSSIFTSQISQPKFDLLDLVQKIKIYHLFGSF